MLKTFSSKTSPIVLASVADYFKVLSEVSRLQILSCLRSGAMNGKEITEATGLGQANLSKHLKALTQAGIISRQPQGVSVYYEIADPMIFDLCELVCDRISNQMQQRAKEFEQFTAFTTPST
ncbi:MAG: helix-turn-helix transcriptional regulator [Hydrococcus sp. C42_A2020_068]|uniref:ArsR/SmtB family transcription factor n=1 Tax=Pleurocapsa sp. PCC 7327 TaxID=118163 RepID=UPI00029FC1B4|nr:metalloregulator ArsR/SmtB family transcription factor [Pleurocapsa sp. PCC 7327]AFY78138.1 putative transcriptional regulator [Pleurocapsa sp. PCC 7327]MBF2019752.1 helix-turn-helix transcriptional regulator [Hydrococcus sp. C42_A2020_068]